MRTFRIAINMAGAISAGAYTAGVLDFLTEALDAWSKARSENQPVLAHRVSIDVFTGASAGGMCAAISALLLQDDFEHISDTNKTNTSNRFYESWVNMIDIRPLLQTNDLDQNTSLVSLLDSSILDTIAQYALVRGTPLNPPRDYLSPDLTLFLSLTNLRGTTYSLNGVAPGSVEETAFYYGDRIRFQTIRTDSKQPLDSHAYAVDLKDPNANGTVLQTAAKATGAFPVFLAPRVLNRRQTDYTPPLWESYESAVKNNPPPISPSFPPNLPEQFETLNVDGGVTNNDPFNYAHDFLASLDPPAPQKQLETDPCLADRAVLSIAPFPSTETYSVKFDAKANSSVFRALPRLVSALIAQSRFFGESLTHLMRGTTFSHFIIAPSDDQLAQHNHGKEEAPPALQCATLGAFGGFFARGFRAHDYALGRRNCQKFLSDHFILPAENVVMKEGIAALPPELRETIIKNFRTPAPTDPDGNAVNFPPESGVNENTVWLPIIPLCTPQLHEHIPAVPRFQMTKSDLNQVIRLIGKRFKAVAHKMIGKLRIGFLRIFLTPGPWFIELFGRKPLTQALIKQLGDSYKPD